MKLYEAEYCISTFGGVANSLKLFSLLVHREPFRRRQEK
jgi:hypothetical protein